jgi:group I intron endonuclease
MKICGIYKITSPTGKVYIGQSTDVKRRFSKYKKLSCNRQFKLYNSFLKYGTDKHIFEILTECSESNLNELEIYYISLYNSFNTDHGLNLRSGGQNGKLSEESKNRIKISTKQYVAKNGNHCKGKKASEESKQKMSFARKAYIEKHGQYPMRYVFTKEVREKMRKAQLGKKQSIALIKKRTAHQNKKVIQFNINNEIIKEWDSIKSAAKAANLSVSYFSRLIKNNSLVKNTIWKIK